MRKTNKIIISVVIIIFLILGIGYAAIQNVTLNIAGTASADASQSNFKVMFTGTPVVSDSSLVTASITDDTNATINVRGLTTKGETLTAEYMVQNVSTDLSADLSVATVNSNAEYFRITSELAKTSLTAGEVTTLTLTIELIKTPLTEVSSTIGTQLESMPVQPGEEGSSGLTNDFSQTPEKLTLASLTEDNIGDYIDLGNDIIDNSLTGTRNVTTDDWRILYKDKNAVYVILSDYLPAEQVPESENLNTDPIQFPYAVGAMTEENLVNELKNTTTWSNFTNEIPGATATGSPTLELLLRSYNQKNQTEIVYTGNSLSLDNTTEDYNLYIPHTDKVDECQGYWLATFSLNYSTTGVNFMNYNGSVCDGIRGYVNHYYNGIRPVVALPTNVATELVDGVWKIIH